MVTRGGEIWVDLFDCFGEQPVGRLHFLFFVTQLFGAGGSHADDVCFALVVEWGRVMFPDVFKELASLLRAWESNE